MHEQFVLTTCGVFKSFSVRIVAKSDSSSYRLLPTKQLIRSLELGGEIKKVPHFPKTKDDITWKRGFQLRLQERPSLKASAGTFAYGTRFRVP